MVRRADGQPWQPALERRLWGGRCRRSLAGSLPRAAGLPCSDGTCLQQPARQSPLFCWTQVPAGVVAPHAVPTCAHVPRRTVGPRTDHPRRRRRLPLSSLPCCRRSSRQSASWRTCRRARRCARVLACCCGVDRAANRPHVTPHAAHMGWAPRGPNRRGRRQLPRADAVFSAAVAATACLPHDTRNAGQRQRGGVPSGDQGSCASRPAVRGPRRWAPAAGRRPPARPDAAAACRLLLPLPACLLLRLLARMPRPPARPTPTVPCLAPRVTQPLPRPRCRRHQGV